MKKVINGFDVEVVRANVYTDETKSKLVFNNDTNDWQVVNHVERAGVTYTINKVIEVGAEFYRPTESTGGFLDHAISKWVAEGKEHGLELSKEILEGINREILTDFFNKSDSMIPTDLQYYNGEDELTSLDKSVEHRIQLLLSDMYYYKGVYFSITNIKQTENPDLINARFISGDITLDYTIDFNNEDYLREADYNVIDKYIDSLNIDDEYLAGSIKGNIERSMFEKCYFESNI